jgi:hypothetical protein
VWRWRKRGGVLLWALPRGESGHAKGITNAASMIFKPKHGKGEEGGLARRCHTVGKGGGGHARPCVVGRCDRGPGAVGVGHVAVLKQGKNEREGMLTHGSDLVYKGSNKLKWIQI